MKYSIDTAGGELKLVCFKDDGFSVTDPSAAEIQFWGEIERLQDELVDARQLIVDRASVSLSSEPASASPVEQLKHGRGFADYVVQRARDILARSSR